MHHTYQKHYAVFKGLKYNQNNGWPSDNWPALTIPEKRLLGQLALWKTTLGQLAPITTTGTYYENGHPLPNW